MNKKELTYKIIGCCMEVHTAIGCGLLEQWYHNSWFFSLKEAGFDVKYNAPFNVFYKEHQVGECYSDLVVDNEVIIELKSVKKLSEVHLAQLINYLHIA